MKDKNQGAPILYFTVSFMLIALGIIMLIFDIIKTGRHYLTKQNSAKGGPILIFIGVIVLLVAYFSMSPFSAIREFFEGKSKFNKKKKD